MATQDSVTVTQLLDVARRRLWLIALVTALGTVVGGVVVLLLPDVFEARTVVHIEQGVLPASFTKTGIAVPKLTEVIGGFREEVLSRQNLRSLINDLGFYEENAHEPGSASAAGAGPSGPIERLTWRDPIERAREDVRVGIVKRHSQVFVEIVVQARRPELAAQAAKRIADTFSSKNYEFRVQLARDVQQFLETEIAEARRVFEQREALMRTFRSERFESLPENEAALHARTSTIWGRTETQRRRLEEAEAERAAIDLQIGNLIGTLAGRGPGGAPPPDAPKTRLDLLREAEAALVARGYTLEHPDRRRLRRQIAAEVKERRDAAEAATSPPETTPALDGAPPEGPVTTADGPGLMAELARRGASEKTLAETRELLGRLASLGAQVELLIEQQERDLRELERLEVLKATTLPTKMELAKRGAAVTEARDLFDRLIDDRDSVGRFLAAEEARRGDQLRTIDAAETPLVPVAPRRLRMMGAVLTGAFLCAFALAFLLEKRRDVYRDEPELSGDLGQPVLAVIPPIVSRNGRHPTPPSEATPELPIAAGASDGQRFQLNEQLNLLRHSIDTRLGQRNGAAVLVTSAVQGEGKSLLAAGVALSFARSLDHSAILIDADLRSPSLARLFGLKGGPGLEDHVVDDTPIAEIVRPTAVPKLSVIASTRMPRREPADIIDSAKMRTLIDGLRAAHPDSVLVIDAPPIIPTPDPLCLAALVDGVVLVVEAGASRRPTVRRALEALPREKVLGMILNRAHVRGGQEHGRDAAADASVSDRLPAQGSGGGNGASAS